MTDRIEAPALPPPSAPVPARGIVLDSEMADLLALWACGPLRARLERFSEALPPDTTLRRSTAAFGVGAEEDIRAIRRIARRMGTQDACVRRLFKALGWLLPPRAGRQKKAEEAGE